jgi:hypothetical protein
MRLTLYRGITTPISKVDDVIKKIRKQGLFVGQGNWILLAADLRHANLKELVHNPNLTITITREKHVETFASTGDYETALYYACKHNRVAECTEGVVIEFTVPIDRVFVDGRDFLYTVFQGFDSRDKSEKHKEEVKNILKRIFGSGILPYVNELFKTSHENQSRRIALVDIIINDRRIIVAHKKNRIWINGRYGTWFRNSFLVEGKIPPEDVVNVEHVKCEEIVFKRNLPPFVIPKSYIKLDDLI